MESHTKLNEPKFFDNRYYMKTASADTLEAVIRSQSSVCLVGEPGSGKTSLAWNTGIKFHGYKLGGKPCILQVVTCVDQGFSLQLDENKRVILLLDGCFENCLVDTFSKELYLDILTRTLPPIIEQAFATVLITVSTAAFEILISSKVSTNILASFRILHTNSLTAEERKNIYYSHLMKKAKNKNGSGIFYRSTTVNLIEESAKEHGVGYPLLVDIFSSYIAIHFYKNDEKFRFKLKRIFGFLNAPTERIKEEIHWNGNCSSYNRLCTLVYMVLNGGFVDVNNLNHSVLDGIWRAYGAGPPQLEFTHYLIHESERQAGLYVLPHERILQVLFSSIETKLLEFTIRNCDVSLLLKYARAGKKQKGEYFLFIDKEEHLNIMIDRMIEHCINIDFHVICKNVTVQKILRKRSEHLM